LTLLFPMVDIAAVVGVTRDSGAPGQISEDTELSIHRRRGR